MANGRARKLIQKSDMNKQMTRVFLRNEPRVLSQPPRDVKPQLLMISWTLSTGRNIMNVRGLYYSIVYHRSVSLPSCLFLPFAPIISCADKSICLVPTKLHNHSANYFVPSDCAKAISALSQPSTHSSSVCDRIRVVSTYQLLPLTAHYDSHSHCW